MHFLKFQVQIIILYAAGGLAQKEMQLVSMNTRFFIIKMLYLLKSTTDSVICFIIISLKCKINFIVFCKIQLISEIVPKLIINIEVQWQI